MVQKDLIFKLEGNLKKYLRQKTKYSMKKLKERLEVENYDDVYFLLIRILKGQMINYNFETPVLYNKFLYKIIDYFDDKNYEVKNKEYFIKQFEEIKEIINKNLRNNESETWIAIDNESFLLNIYSYLNVFLYRLKGIDYDECNEKDTYNLMKDLIFKVKNPAFIDEVFDKYENLSTLKDDQRYLFEDIIDRYLYVLINSDDRYEILYFDKLVNKFITDTDSEEIKSIAVHKIDKLYSTLDEKILTKERKELIRFFLKETTKIYSGIKEDRKTVLSNLKIKYDIDRIKSLDKFKLVNPSWKNYKPCNRFIVTFDDPKAKVFENAVSLDITESGEFLLNYYVSDVNSYIEEDEDLREYVRNNSLSFKGNPLLPEDIRKRISLIEGKKRKVLTFKFKFDNEFNLVGFRVDKEIIKVKYNLKFSDVKKILQYPVDSKLKTKVKDLFAFSKCLPIGYDNKELSKNMFYEKQEEKNKGAKMINNYQLFLNYFISNYCSTNDLPFLYKNNCSDRRAKQIDKLKEKYIDNENIQDMLNLMYSIYEPSYFLTKNQGHMGLNLDAYGEISKPARSYASILNQALITRYLIDGETFTPEEKQEINEWLMSECKFINNRREMHDNYIIELRKVKKKCK